VFPRCSPAAALYAPANRKVLEEDFAKLGVLLEKGPEALDLGRAAEPPGSGLGQTQSGSEQSVSTSEVSETAPSLSRESELVLGQATQGTEQLPLW
jgi:hypothetical protein